jgi:hypothetical protein
MNTEKSYTNLFTDLENEFLNAAAKLALKMRQRRADPIVQSERRSFVQWAKQLSPATRVAVLAEGKRGQLEQKRTAIEPIVVRATRLVLRAISENAVILGPVADAAKFLPQCVDDDSLRRFWNQHVVPELSKDSPAEFAKLPASPAGLFRRYAMACSCLARACWSEAWAAARWFTKNTRINAGSLRKAAEKNLIVRRYAGKKRPLYLKSSVKSQWPEKWENVK